MEYNDVVAAMFEPDEPGTVSAATVDGSSARRLRDAIEPLAMHSVWNRTTNERLAALGHNFMTGYVCSRAALLGEPTPGAVVSAFAVFEPNMLTGAYEAGRTVCDRSTLLSTRDESTIASLSAVLDGVDVEPIAQHLRDGIEAADGTGRPLFSGLRDLPWPDSPVGQLWRACELFREHRGDSHVVACVAAGLDAVEMNVLTELFVGMPVGTYSASRAWDEAALSGAVARLTERGFVDGDELSTNGANFRRNIEAETDRLQQPIIDALGSNLEPVIEAASAWSQRCIEAKAFPPSVFKRAAG